MSLLWGVKIWTSLILQILIMFRLSPLKTWNLQMTIQRPLFSKYLSHSKNYELWNTQLPHMPCPTWYQCFHTFNCCSIHFLKVLLRQRHLHVPKKEPHPQIYLSKNMTKYCDVRTKGVSLLLGTFYSLKCPLIII